MKKAVLFFLFFGSMSWEVWAQQCPDFQEVRPDVYIAKDDSGWYVNIGSNSTNQFGVARCFYQRYPERDHYDFMWIEQTIYNNQNPHTFSVAERSGGVAPSRYDTSWTLGSKGRLTAISWDKRECTDPIGRSYSGSANNHCWNTVMHEFAHHACCYYDQNRVGYSDLFPPTSAGASMSNGHLSPWLGTISNFKTELETEGLMEDLPYAVDSSGKATYRVPREERLQKPSPFAAYTLGFISPSEIRGNFPVVHNTVWDSQTMTVRGEVKRWVGVNELIALQWGKRWPVADHAQRHFRAAMILLVDMRDPETLRPGVDKWVNQFIESTAPITAKWVEAMSGRSTLNDVRFRIPRLRTDKPQFLVGETLSIKMTGADPNVEALLLAYNGSQEYQLLLKARADGSWEFTALMGSEHIGGWSAIVYFGPDRETGGLTHTTSTMLFFEVVAKK